MFLAPLFSGSSGNAIALEAGSLRLLVDAGSYFGVDDYVIGLVCGMGSPVLDAWEITAEAVGENLVVTADDSGAVTLEFLNS